MNPDFMKLKPLEGELKLSHKKTGFGITVTTKEVVIHKPHVNYYVRLADIVSITPFELKGSRVHVLNNGSDMRFEVVQNRDGTPSYSLFATQATVHNRSGLHTHGAIRFIIPIDRDLMKAIGQYGAWDIALDT
jgi:hypothetical protein